MPGGHEADGPVYESLVSDGGDGSTSVGPGGLDAQTRPSVDPPVAVTPDAGAEDAGEEEPALAAVAMALAGEPPIPPALRPAVEDDAAPDVPGDLEPTTSSPSVIAVAPPIPAEAVQPVVADEVKEVDDFWNPPAVAPPPPSLPTPTPWESTTSISWPLDDSDQDHVSEWAGDNDWPEDDEPRRRRRVGSFTPLAAIADRWATMRRGERVNVVLYLLTGVSIIAMALELLAGPDSLPTEVRTSPMPVVSTPTTVRQSTTTVTFTLPAATEDPAPGPGTASPAPAAPVPRAPAPTAAADPEPNPTAAPTTAPPATTTAPPTTQPGPPTTPGFTPVPPVLPSFPTTPITQPSFTIPSTPGP